MLGLIHIRTGLPGTGGDGSQVEITVTEPGGSPVTTNTETLIIGNEVVRFLGLNFVPTTSPFTSFPTVGALFVLIDVNGMPTSIYSGTTNGPRIAATRITLGTCYEIQWTVVSTLNAPGYIIPTPQPATPAFFYYDIVQQTPVTQIQTFAVNPSFGRKLSDTDGFVSDTPGTPGVPRPAYIDFNGMSPWPAIPIVYSATPCCIVEETKLRTSRGLLAACEVAPGDWLYRQDGSAAQVQRNVRFAIPTSDFIQLGEPGGEFLIKGDHPILEDGAEILAKDSKSAKVIFASTPKIVHTFITEKRDFIDISGVQVGTWSQDAFENFIEQDSRGQTIRFNYVN